MKYAIIQSGGKQYRAVEGGTIEVDRLPARPGENVKLEQILLFADGDSVTVGTPLIQDLPVWTTVLEHFKGKKVTIFNYSPKKRIRVKTGHRQNYTRLAIEQIGGSEFVKKEPVSKQAKAVEVDAVEEPAPKPSAAKKAAPKAEKKPSTKAPAKAKTAGTAAKAPRKATTPKVAPKPAEKSSSRKPVAKKPAAKKPARKE